jgi:hypothetical protein
VTTQEADPLDDRQTWWWRILTPLVCAFVPAMWSIISLGRLQERQHHDLYGLLAYSDSTKIVSWNAGGEHFAYLFLELPWWCGIGSMMISLVVGSLGLRSAGLATVAGYWLFGLICVAGFAAFMGWLWINAIGVFI